LKDNYRLLTKEQAYQKIKHYCAYQERCHREVEDKLYQLKVPRSYHGELISSLIEENYLNEERFAIMYAGGKFRMKQWGRRKILHELRSKQVSEYCIKKALKEISNNDYAVTIEKLVRKKMAALKGETFQVKKQKTLEYMIGKGYEPDQTLPAIEELKPVKKKASRSTRSKN
jgi:regulatory protein